MSAVLCAVFAATLLFAGKSPTELVEVPSDLKTGEFVLTFDATFPKGAPRQFLLRQYFTCDNGARELYTNIGFAGPSRTLGFIDHSQYTAVPWFYPALVTDRPVQDGETRRVQVIAHGGYLYFNGEFDGEFRCMRCNKTYPGFRLDKLRFDALGSPSVVISNVKLAPYAGELKSTVPEGFTGSELPTHHEIPVKRGRLGLKLRIGRYPAEPRLTFVDDAEKPYELTLLPFVQDIKINAAMKKLLDGQGNELYQSAKTTGVVKWIDSGIRLKSSDRRPGSETAVYTRTRLKERYKGEQMPGIFTNLTRYGECASAHIFDFDIRRRTTGKWQLWLDGEFIREIPIEGEFKSLKLDLPPGASYRVAEAASAAERDLVEELPVRAPFAVADCRENLGSYYLTRDGYRSRSPLDAMPDCYLRRVPNVTYVGARVRCRLGGNTNLDTRITARLTCFENISDAGRSPDAMTQETKVLKRGKNIYEIDFAFDPGRIQDLVWQFGYDALNFEVLGGCNPVGYIGTSADKPDEAHPSDVVVLGAELIRAPAGLCVLPKNFGNLYYADAETPTMTAHVVAEKAGDYRVTWVVKDVRGKVVETLSDGIRLAAGGSNAVTRVFAARTPGWYGVTTFLGAADNKPFMKRESSFVVQAPDTRKAVWDSPYFTWCPQSIRRSTNAVEFARWGDLLNRMGLHRATLIHPAAEERHYAKWRLTVDPAPGIYFSESPDKAERIAKYERDVKDHMRRFPHTRSATVMHENYGGVPPLEMIGGKTKISEGQKAADKLWTERATELAGVWRRLYPHVKLSLANSGDCLKTLAQLYRGGLDKSLIDGVGEETTGGATIPEMSTARAMWNIRELSRTYGYDHVGSWACYEWKSRPRRHFESLRTQAAYYVRDALIAHAWRSPTIPVGTGPEPDTSYFTTTWGDGVFTREPLMQPMPGVAAVSTLTRVLDSCAFRRVVPLSSKTVYCLEFTRGDEWVYALWTPRGAVKATLRTKAGKAVRTDCYGASTDEARMFSSRIATEISDEPCYFTLNKPLLAVELAPGGRAYPGEDYPGLKDARTLATAAAYGPVKDEPKAGGVTAGGGFLPTVIPGSFDARTVEDAEKGTVVEMTLRTDSPVASPLMREYGFVEFAEPVSVPTDAHTLAVDVKGNSSWGRMYVLLVDAKGQRWMSSGQGGECYSNDQGLFSLDFDGWHRMSLLLDEKSPMKYHSRFPGTYLWRCTTAGINAKMAFPVKVVGFGAMLSRHTLNILEMEPTESLSVRFGDILAY